MKEFKVTSGPWFNNGTAIYACECSDYLAEEMSVDEPIEVQIANAHLIAAAPELLSAVNLILELQLRGFITLGDKHTGTLSSAVAKALGE